MITDFLRRMILGKKEKFLFQSYWDGLIDFEQIPEEIGLYIHIPFCRSICPYCPYNKEIYEKEKALKYKETLLQELELYEDRLTDKKISSLYIGGGTPALLIHELKEIIQWMRNHYSFHGDIGIELYPSEVDEELLYTLREIGINLISLGVQTFNEKALKILGRNYGEAEIDRVLRRISDFGFQCVDVDIMTNLPGQSMKDIEYDLRKIYDYGIDQLSIYPLILFPMTQLRETVRGKGLKRFSELEEVKILKTIDQISKAYGYERSSIWTYGKDEKIRYTSVTRESFIGMGAGASSHFGEYFYLNTFDVDAYIQALQEGNVPINLVNQMTKREKMIFWLFWRCYDGIIDERRFQELFQKDMQKEFKLLFQGLKLFRMIEKQEGKWVLTNPGRYAYHFVEKQYSIHYLNDLWQQSMKQPWIERICL